MVVKEQLDRVRVLRLANPPSNVLNLGLLSTLRNEIAQAGEDPAVRCLVLASSYPRYFSTGLDLGEMLSLPPDRRTEPFGALIDVFRALRSFPKPTVACIGGSAVLGGWILAMGCDFRFLSEGTGKIALSEIRFGVSPGPALLARLREIASSPSLVRELVLRGRTLRADEAFSGGFVDRLIPEEQLLDECLKEAKSLCRLAPGAYAAIKRALPGRSKAEEEQLWAASREEFDALFKNPEALEGLTAMRDKRKPRWEA